jgi:putative pyruvate formate lyase activating enzyme
MLSINPCNVCPRQCGVNRNIEMGFCSCGAEVKIARAALHMWEEPCISGSCGSGTVFFSGCSLGCVYCQNDAISQGGTGKVISAERLAQIFLELQEKGAHNINLVTATPWVPQVCDALDIARPTLHIPVVFNCGGYERVETIQALDGYVDIYLPDIKYFSGELAQRYSHATDYFDVASKAVQEMIAQTDGLEYDADGLLRRGVIIRHLVLPGGRHDSMALLRWMATELPRGKFLLSLMSQYTPTERTKEFPEINRRVTSMEYGSVVNEALRFGLDNGYMQQRGSADKAYIPQFDLEGV